MSKNETELMKKTEEIFQVPTEEQIKRRELISVLAELILDYSLTKKD